MLPRRWLAAVLLATAFDALADTPDSGERPEIVGRVVDGEDGSPLPGVLIRLRREQVSEFQIVAKTDIRGVYGLHGLPPATDYIISVDYAGFAPMMLNPLEVNEGDRIRLDITLRSSAQTTQVWISGRTLDEPELRLYLDAEKRIREMVRTDQVPTIHVIVLALQEIDDLPEDVQEDARGALRDTIWEELEAVVEPGNPFILDLLRDPDPSIQLMAINILYNQDTSVWLQDPELRSFLQELLASSGGDVSFTKAILTVYVFANRFDEVRNTALALAGGGDPEMAQSAASVIAWHYEQSKDWEGLRKFFQESDGVPRQVAATWLAENDAAALDAAERKEVAVELVRTMEDPSMSPGFRGQAIEAAGWLHGDPIIQQALVGLLDPSAWFGAIPDVCHAKHSLTVVFEALDPRPEIVGDLMKLKNRLELLETSDRSRVERLLDEILSKLRNMALAS